MSDANKGILLVEDNPDDAALTLRAFKRSHVVNPIDVARDGIEALDFPVVILTSSKEEQDLIAGYSLGANSYVRKPVDFAEFLEAVKVLGIYWLMMNQGPPDRSTP